MALTKFSNAGVFLGVYPNLPHGTINNNQHATIDAAGESTTVIGRIFLEAGTGTKTLSAAGGGKIHYILSSANFSNAGTNLRIGVQDVGATGLEDGTFDVFADLVGGTDTLSTQSVLTVAMESGSKSITHQDLIAVSFEFTTRGGTDSIALRFDNGSSLVGLPYITTDTGAGPAKAFAGAATPVVLEFDDGTIGYFVPCLLMGGLNVSTSVNLNSTPDEYALVFTAPINFKISSIWMMLSAVVSTDDFEVIIYTNPTTAVSASLTIAYDADIYGNSGNTLHLPLASSFEFVKGTEYAIALRPTTANNINIQIGDFNTGNGKLRRQTPFGESWALGSRTNQSGNFSLTTTQLPIMGMFVSEIHDEAVGGGSVETSYTFG